MMSVMTYNNAINYPFFLRGEPHTRELETLAQDASRAAALAPFTLMGKDSAGKWAPLTDVNPALTAAYLTCGALAGNLAAWQAVTDGEFGVNVDGVAINLTGLDFSGISALTGIATVINLAAAGRFTVIDNDGAGGSFTLVSPKLGLGASSITVLSTVAGGTGTDISAGTVGLNGASGTGSVTLATGSLYETVPAGIYIGAEVTAAALVAGDVENKPITVLGTDGLTVDKNQLVLENSLALTDVIKARGINKTIEDYLADALGIITKDSVDMDEYENA